jgi:uncharacterized protein YecT (DUF1311 family)
VLQELARREGGGGLRPRTAETWPDEPEGPQAQPEEVPPRADGQEDRPPRRWLWPAAGVLAALTVGVGVGLWGSGLERQPAPSAPPPPPRAAVALGGARTVQPPPAAAPEAAEACASQATPADRVLCEDPELAPLAAELQQAYATALAAHHEHRELLRRRQQAWQAARDGVTDPDRLASLYRRRIHQLEVATAAAQRRGGRR